MNSLNPWFRAKDFVFLVLLYLLLSTTVFFGVANTIYGWLVYIFGLLPFFVLMLLSLAMLAQGWRGRRVQVRPVPALLVILSQILTILCSPGNCYGFKQGYTCYSIAQVWFGQVGEITFRQRPIHWTAIENGFIPCLVVYCLALVIALVSVRRSA